MDNPPHTSGPLPHATLHAYNQPQSLRQRIIRESRDTARSHNRKPRKQHFRAPPFPGAAAFNLHNGLSELPRSGANAGVTIASIDQTTVSENAGPEMIPDAASWTSDEHYEHVMRELDELEATSRSNSPSQISFFSGDNIQLSSPDSWLQDQPCQCAKPLAHGSYPQEHCECHVQFLEKASQNQDVDLSKEVDQQTTSVHFANDHGGNPPPGQEQTSSHVPLVKQPTTRPISEQQLIDEVRGIYAGLVMVEKRCVEVVTEQTQSARRLEIDQWNALIALHRTLLQEHHDFFSASQHPAASSGLKQLAIKYAMPARMWKHGIRPALDLMRSENPHWQSLMASFVAFAYRTTEALEMDMPHLFHEWNMIRYNLREYCLVLKAQGVDLPSPFLDEGGYVHSPSASQLRQRFPPMSDEFFGDDRHVEEFFKQSLMQELMYDEEEDAGNVPDWPVGEVALRFMNGWLHYGRKIATSFHSFAHTFIFLGLVGSGAALLE